MNLAPMVLSLGVLLAVAATPARADEIIVRSVADAPPNSPEGVLRPTRGMSMEQVTRQFGAPAQQIAPVGEPPITRWVYDGFTVYFEHQYVIHSVTSHK